MWIFFSQLFQNWLPPKKKCLNHPVGEHASHMLLESGLLMQLLTYVLLIIIINIGHIIIIIVSIVIMQLIKQMFIAYIDSLSDVPVFQLNMATI